MACEETIEARKRMMEKCRGCDDLCDKIQTSYYEDDHVTRRKTPLRTMEKFCREYGLHLEQVDRIHKHAAERGQPEQLKYCPKFRNG